MILPGSSALALSILVLCMLCWGLWPGTIKLAGKWRIELYYIDFAIGVLVASLIGAFTFGSMGWDGFSALDDFHLAGKRHELFAFVAGAVFSLGNMLLMASISMAGIAYALPIGMGTALAVGSCLAYAGNRQGSLPLLIVGLIVIAAAVVVAAMAYREMLKVRLAIAPEPGKKAPRRVLSYKAMVTGVLGGVLIGSFFVLLTWAGEGEDGLGPYSSGLVFAIGFFISALIFDLFFMSLPIQGRPLDLSAYFAGRGPQHLTGMLGGMLWMTGLIGILVVARSDPASRPKPVLQFLLPQLAPLLAVFLGLLIWKEMAGGTARAKTMTTAMLLMYAVGLGFLCAAPVIGAR